MTMMETWFQKKPSKKTVELLEKFFPSQDEGMIEKYDVEDEEPTIQSTDLDKVVYADEMLKEFVVRWSDSRDYK